MSEYCLNAFTVTKKIGAARLLLFNIVTGKKAVIGESVLLRLFSEKSDALSDKELFVRESFFVDAKNYGADLERTSLSIITKAIKDSKRLSLYLAVTEQCNFRCPYCFMEKNLTVNGDYISESTLQHVAQWIADRNNKYSYSSVVVNLYGGEPFYEPQSLARVMRSLCGKIPVPVSFYAATNGYNLSTRDVRELKSTGLKKIMVTLDGPDQLHNKRRVLANGSEGTFSRILSNIKAVAPILPVCVRVNVDSQNIVSVSELISLLKSESLEKLVTIDMYPVEAGCSNNAHCANFALSKEELGGFVELWKIAAQNGFRLEKKIPFAAPCFFYGKHSFAIDPSGDIYPCPGMIGNKSWLCGSVSMDAGFEKQVPMVWKECLGCENIFCCAGGCRVFALSEKADISYRNCRKEFMSRVRQEYFNLHIDAQHVVDGKC